MNSAPLPATLDSRANPWRLGSVHPPRPLPKALPRRHRIGPEARCVPGFLFLGTRALDPSLLVDKLPGLDGS
jgi:hypothetical protein